MPRYLLGFLNRRKSNWKHEGSTPSRGTKERDTEGLIT